MKRTNLLLLLTAWLMSATAQTNTWLGNTPGWLNTGNWSLGIAPTSSCAYDVYIPAVPVGGLFPIIGPAVSPSIGSLTIESGATLTIGALGLNVCGSVTGGAGTPAQLLGNGELKLIGTGTQTISGALKCHRLHNQNTSPGGVVVTGDVQVVFYWKCEDGDLTNNGSITLLSDAAGTAYLDLFTYPGAAAYNGNITVQQYIDNAADGYRDLSVPVSTTVADLSDDFTIAGQHGVNCWYAYSPYPTFQEYREQANADTSHYYGGFWSLSNAGAALGGAKGYAARIYNAPLTLDVTGPPATGVATIAVSHTPSLTPSADGWNLVGNPFCAPIQWSAVLAQNPGVTSGSCYRFSTTGEYAGTWSAHNGVTGVPLSTPDEISMSQGFFVHVPMSGLLAIDPAACVASSTVPFYKTESLPNELRLQLSNGTQADEIVAYTDANATPQYDAGRDALKMPAGGPVQISFLADGKELAIQVLDEIPAQAQWPLSVSVTHNGSYTLRAIAVNLPSLTAYLQDAQTNTLYDLSIEAPVFNLSGGQSYAGRFSVVLAPAVSAVAGVKTAPAHIRLVGSDVHIERSSATRAEVVVSNLLGQQITAASVSEAAAVIRLPENLQGYALVRVQEGDKISTQKLFIPSTH